MMREQIIHIKMTKKTPFGEYLKKQSRRINQKFDLIADNPDFKKKIVELRKKWGIAPSGFTESKQLQQFEFKLGDSSDDFLDRNEAKFALELDKIKKKNYKLFLDRQKELNDQVPINAFRKDIDDLIKDFKLPPRWFSGLRTYLITNKPMIIFGLGIEKKVDLATGEELLYIRIDENTTLQDIIDEWDTVKMHQKDLPYRKAEKFQPIPNLELYKKCYDLNQSGLRPKEIAQRSKELLGEEYLWYEISKYISNYKKHIDINSR